MILIGAKVKYSILTHPLYYAATSFFFKKKLNEMLELYICII